MFELDDQDSIILMMNEFQIEPDDRHDLRPFLEAFADGEEIDFEASISAFIALYVAREVINWRDFLTEANLNTFVCDSILIMCAEAAHLNNEPWMDDYDIMGDMVVFVAEQFINIFG